MTTSFQAYANKLTEGNSHSQALEKAIPLDKLQAIPEKFYKAFKDEKYQDSELKRPMRFPVDFYQNRIKQEGNKPGEKSRRLEEIKTTTIQIGENIELQTEIDSKLKDLLYKAP